MATTTDKLRNVAIIGQRGSGKTTLAEAMAYSAEATNRLGSITEGTTIADYTDEEKAKQQTLNLSLLALTWNKHKVNLIDVPGNMDFIGDVISGIAVADTVGVVINASSGVEVGTIQFFPYVESAKKPAFFVVNRLDKENTDFNSNVEAIVEAFGTKCMPIVLPIGKANGFKGVVDLIKMKAITFDEKGSQTLGDIPGDMQADVDAAREKMMEAVAESDDALLEKFFDQGSLSDDELLRGLQKGIATGKLYPILAAAATSNIGASHILDIVVTYMPSPADSPLTMAQEDEDGEATVEVPCNTSDPVCAYVFKTISEQHVGDLSLVKVMSGKLASGVEVLNIQRNNSERIGQIYQILGKDRKEVDAAEAGDIVALVKLKDTHTGNTLADKGRRYIIPMPDYPEPVMDMAIRPKAKGDEEKVGMGLSKLGEADPTFKVVQDPALKQTLLFGQGPTQVDLLVERLKTRFGVDVELDRPKIPFRETIKGKAEVQGKHKKQSGGRGQFGDCWLRLEPMPRGEGFEFVDEIKGGVIPGKFVPSVEKGVVEAMQEGGLCGAQVVDIKVAVYFGSYHAVDSSDMAFKIAGSIAFKDGYMKAKPTILEPIYKVTIFVPDEYTGDVMGDVSSRRGKIIGMDPVGKMQRIRASIPQAELYKYSVDLRSMTQGQGVYSREFSHYEEVPHDVAVKLQEEYKASRQEAQV